MELAGVLTGVLKGVLSSFFFWSFGEESEPASDLVTWWKSLSPESSSSPGSGCPIESAGRAAFAASGTGSLDFVGPKSGGRGASSFAAADFDGPPGESGTDGIAVLMPESDASGLDACGVGDGGNGAGSGEGVGGGESSFAAGFVGVANADFANGLGVDVLEAKGFGWEAPADFANGLSVFAAGVGDAAAAAKGLGPGFAPKTLLPGIVVGLPNGFAAELALGVVVGCPNGFGVEANGEAVSVVLAANGDFCGSAPPKTLVCRCGAGVGFGEEDADDGAEESSSISNSFVCG